MNTDKDLSADKLATLSADIAAALPGDWTVVDRDDHTVRGTHFVRADGLDIYIRDGGWGDEGKLTFAQHYRTEAWKVEATGSYADPTRYDTNLPKIRAANTKKAVVLARDIAKRLLPDAEEMHTKAVASKAGSDKYHAKRKANLEALGFPVARTPSYTSDGPVYEAELGSYRAGGARGKVEAQADEVRITLENLTVEQAKAVLAVLTFES
jgi:hypothetical protein